jgi:hypothetical protein
MKRWRSAAFAGQAQAANSFTHTDGKGGDGLKTLDAGRGERRIEFMAQPGNGFFLENLALSWTA